MCGIVGFINLRKTDDESTLSTIVSKMTDTLAHRGPDDRGVWASPQSGVALGHRRLSILDLSADGRQPMRSSSRRYMIAFNGEIYNFAALKKQLTAKGHSFQGHSDTPVLLAAIEEWGVEKALPQLDGMFAFALWDEQEQKLYIARDRLGKKPLYYGWLGDSFVFGSELKALRAHPSFNQGIDRNVLALYMRYGYIPSPYSIYEDIHKLPPSSFTAISNTSKTTPTPHIYWDIRKVAQDGERHRLKDISDDDAINQLDTILGEAVKSRMIADVPLGAFLSGGVDSSLIVALMQKHENNKVKTFSIGFENAKYDESAYAKDIAQHIGTDHTEFIITPQDALDTVGQIPQMFDEPFADPSQIPTYHVARLAKQHVTVALSGDGGDESFAGYWRYGFSNLMNKYVTPIPRPIRSVVGGVVQHTPFFPDRVRKVGSLLKHNSRQDAYTRLMSYHPNPERFVLNATEPLLDANNPELTPALSNAHHDMMLNDMRLYLPDDILTKVDRTSMAASLEARSPFLDHHVMSYAWRLPLHLKVRNGEQKWILKALLERYVPSALFDRPKQGFAIPHGEWLRGPLRSWAEDLLAEQRLEQDGYFNAPYVLKMWKEHLGGTDRWGYTLWAILMFQAGVAR